MYLISMDDITAYNHRFKTEKGGNKNEMTKIKVPSRIEIKTLFSFNFVETMVLFHKPQCPSTSC